MIYQIHGCQIEVASGGQSAKGSRLEVKGGGKVLISAASAEFQTMVENRDGIDVTVGAQEQANLWARALPDVIDDPFIEPTDEVEQ